MALGVRGAPSSSVPGQRRASSVGDGAASAHEAAPAGAIGDPAQAAASPARRCTGQLARAMERS
jgi:hypothetical protein